MVTTVIGADGVIFSYSGATTKGIVGTAAANILTGTLGNDAFRAYGGGDTLSGGLGDDTYNISDRRDVVIENANEGVDTVAATVSYTLGANIENLSVTADKSYGGGNSLNNIISGGAGAQILDGMAGNDVLTGGSGGDVFVLGQGGGHDVITDFQNGLDKARLDNLGFTNYSQVQSALTQIGSDVLLLAPNGEQLWFRNHLTSDFARQDFQLSLDSTGMKMTFNEDFNTLNLYNQTTKQGLWWTAYGSANSLQAHTLTNNGELEVYVDPTFAGSGTTPLGLNPFSINNGVLSITASVASASDSAALWGYQYTSGMLTTRTTFAQQYGYFEMRAAMPTGNGFWPAFWLLPTSGGGTAEIDILEQLGRDPNSAFLSSHTQTPGYNSATTTSSYVDRPDQFHKYGMLWDKDYLVWYIDGVEVGRQVTNPDMQRPMYILLNLAVGGYWPGSPDATTQWNTSYQIDYVRAFALPGTTVNTPPVAVAETYAVTAGTPLVVGGNGVLANDSDANGDRINAVLYSGPAHGTVALNADGTFTYTAAAGYTGVDSFLYKAADGTSMSAPTTVTLNVSAVAAAAPAPVAQVAAAPVAAAQVAPAPQPAASPTNAAAPVAAPPTVGAPATLAVKEQGALDLKLAGLSIADPAGTSSLETVTLKVGEGALAVGAGTSGASVTGSGTGTVTITGTVAQINALLASDPGSSVQYVDPLDAPAASTTLTMTATNSFKLSATQVSTIAIAPVNDAPTVTAPAFVAATEQVISNLKALGLAIADPDGANSVETAVLSVGEGVLNVSAGTSGVLVTGSGTGAVTLTGTVAQIDALLATDAASSVTYLDDLDAPATSTTLTLSVQDQGGLTGAAAATIAITPVNDAPTATAPSFIATTEQVISNLKAIGLAIADPDGANSIETVTLSVGEGMLNVSAGASGVVVTGSGTGTVTLTGAAAQINALLSTDAASTVTFTDDLDAPSAFTALTLAVKDQGGLTGVATSVLSIASVNDAPTAAAPTTLSAVEQVALNLKGVGLAVADPDGSNSVVTATLTVGEGALSVGAGNSGVIVSGSGTKAVTLTGTVAQIDALLATDAASTVNYFDPLDAPSPFTALTLSVRDQGGLVGSSTSMINITPVNDAPIAGADTASMLSGGSLKLSTTTLLANDFDPDGDAMAITGVALGQTAHGTVSLSGGVVTYTPNAGYVGMDTISYSLTDGHLAAPVSGMVTVTIVNAAPSYTMGTNGADVFDYSGRMNVQMVNGGGGADYIAGGSANDTLNGGAGDDTLLGGGGADSLVGGVGGDSLTGGAGADRFTFNSIGDFGGPAKLDVINDFNRSDGDKIQLTAIDANTLVAGNQAFSFIGANAFSKVAGQLQYTLSGHDATVTGDVNGDGVADFGFLVLGVGALQASDFLL